MYQLKFSITRSAVRWGLLKDKDFFNMLPATARDLGESVHWALGIMRRRRVVLDSGSKAGMTNDEHARGLRLHHGKQEKRNLVFGRDE